VAALCTQFSLLPKGSLPAYGRRRTSRFVAADVSEAADGRSSSTLRDECLLLGYRIFPPLLGTGNSFNCRRSFPPIAPSTLANLLPEAFQFVDLKGHRG